MGKNFGECLKEWVKEYLTTENTESTEIFQEGLLRDLRALRGEVFWQAHEIRHSLFLEVSKSVGEIQRHKVPLSLGAWC